MPPRVRRIVAGVMLLISSLVVESLAQTIPRAHQHPNGKVAAFKSWSLFLTCDPAWLQSESRADLLLLYNAYLALVMAADETHAPLWAFAGATGWRADEIDPVRTEPYCRALKLSSTSGPFIVITAHPPDSIHAAHPKVLLGLGSRSAKEIAASLLALEERISKHGVSASTAGSREWWALWQKLAGRASGRVSGIAVSVHPPAQPKQ